MQIPVYAINFISILIDKNFWMLKFGKKRRDALSFKQARITPN